MAARESQRGRYVLARAFLEQAHQDDCTLGLAKTVHATAETNALLGMRDQGLGGRRGVARLYGVDGDVRAGEMMTASLVSCRVAHDAGN